MIQKVMSREKGEKDPVVDNIHHPLNMLSFLKTSSQ
jgi:hypothetical protein